MLLYQTGLKYICQVIYIVQLIIILKEYILLFKVKGGHIRLCTLYTVILHPVFAIIHLHQDILRVGDRLHTMIMG